MKYITLDTNCLFDYFERNPLIIHELFNLQQKGQIEIAITTRVMADTYDKWKGEGESPIWMKIQSLPILEKIGTAFRLDISRLDSGDYLVSDEDVILLDSLQSIMKDAQIEDIDHLFGHMKAKRDVFVTSDKHFLDHKELLSKKYNIEVLQPEETIEKLKALE